MHTHLAPWYLKYIILIQNAAAGTIRWCRHNLAFLVLLEAAYAKAWQLLLASLCSMNFVKLLRAISSQNSHDCQHSAYAASTRPARMIHYVCCDIVDLCRQEKNKSC